MSTQQGYETEFQKSLTVSPFEKRIAKLTARIKGQKDPFQSDFAPEAEATSANIPDAPTVKLNPRRAEETPTSEYTPEIIERKTIAPDYRQPGAGPRDTALINSPVIQPRNRREELLQEQASLSSSPTSGRGGEELKKPGRWKGLLQGMLAGVANADVNTGGGSWNDVASMLGSAAGGAVGGAANPDIFLKARHAQAVAENQKELDQQTETEKQTLGLEALKAKNENTGSLITSRERRLDIQEAAQNDKRTATQWSQDFKNRQLALNEKIKNKQIDQTQAKIEQDALDYEERVRHNKYGEGIADRNAVSNRIRAEKPPAGAADNESTRKDAQDDAHEFQSQLNQLDEEAKSIPTFLPKLDSNGEILRDASGKEIPSTTKTPERIAYETERKDIQKQRTAAEKEARKAGHKASASSGKSTTSGKPFNVKAWAAANPDGDVEAAKRKAKSLGYTVVE